ncbi:hypothetical protein IRZ83_04405 [Flavobacterium sp. JLP]|uniref:hypothetical protein n=1 Tax=Flavobacterium sp. JLP TaxID=2783793 RepID=UPI00188A24CF|nr:hypothetical protein [Flavobacterium sp. JLP]MBF4505899.1 hypothetical protein [Flavobacterium sp. JLP]
MKLLLILYLTFFQSMLLLAQSDTQYHIYTNRVVSFSKPNRVLFNNVDKKGNGSIEYTNPKKQVLRFRVLKNKIQMLHGAIAFQLFSYKNGYLEKIETFDINGKLSGEREAANEAVTKFIVDKNEEYLKKKKLIDDAEGNIEMKDDTNEKIIRIELFDANKSPINTFLATYISSKTYWNYNERMYWP